MGIARSSLVWLLALTTLAGCATTGDPKTNTPEPAYYGQPVPARINLLAGVERAELTRPINRITFADPEERVYLPSGWLPFETDPDGKPFAFGHGDRSIVEIPFVRPFLTEITVTLAPLELEELAQSSRYQRIDILWNGQFVRQVELRDLTPKRFTMTVRPDAQRHGVNRLEFRPWYWVRENPELDAPQRSFKCYGIELKNGQIDPGAQPAILPLETDGFTQTPESVLSRYQRMPRAPMLKIRGQLAIPEGTSFTAGRALLLVTLVDESGTETVLDTNRFSLPRGSKWIDKDLPLDGWAGEFAAINFSLFLMGVPETEQSQTVSFNWRHARIEGSDFAEDVPEEIEDEIRAPYNVVLVLFDTLRSDHTEPYGNLEVQTPILANFASNGVTFLDATSNAPWTRPSVASLLTGAYPWQHKAMRLVDLLPPEMPTMPRLLRRADYRTIAVVNNTVISETYGYDKGFDVFRHVFANYDNVRRLPDPRKRAERVWNSHIAPFLPETDDTPFFVYLHELDPHSPYLPPPPYDTMYADPDFQSNIKSGAPFLVNEGGMTILPAHVHEMHARYKGEITFMDAYLGWIVDHLNQQGLAENTLVIFTSDHGEEFLEHGQLRHGQSLYEEQLRVPIMFRMDGLLPAGVSIPGAAESVDILPTVLDLLGMRTPDTVQGRSLLPQMAGKRPISTPRPSFAHNNFKYAVRWGPWKLIKYHDTSHVSNRTGIHPAFNFELFNLERDPGEHFNIYAANLAVSKSLHQRLLDILVRTEGLVADGEEIVLDDLEDSELEDLKALGYL